MSKYIIACGLFHPVLSKEQILTSGQTVSAFGTFDEIKEILKTQNHLFFESDSIPEIEHGTIFTFEDNPSRYYTQFIREGAVKDLMNYMRIF